MAVSQTYYEAEIQTEDMQAIGKEVDDGWDVFWKDAGWMLLAGDG